MDRRWKTSIGSLAFVWFLFVSFALISQTSPKPPRPLAKLANSTAKIIPWTYGMTAPWDFSEASRLPFEDVSKLRLQFPSGLAGFYQGPDSGEVYQWKPGLYKWTRSDRTIFQEWQTGQWQWIGPDGSNLTFFPETKSPGRFILRYSDDTALQKNWVPHRSEYDLIYQKIETDGSFSYLLPDPNRFEKNQKSLGRLDLYYSSSWAFFIEALAKDFEKSNFYSYLKNEYGLESKGRVPVFFFQKKEEISRYVGRTLLNNSQEGGFGGRDSIMVCCGDSKPQKTGDPDLDSDSEKRMFFGTFYHELVHNVAQLHCFSLNAKKEPYPKESVEDWFVEGFANLVASEFEPTKKAYIWEGTETLFTQNKVPNSYSGMVQAKYNHLIPYTLGAYFAYYLQETFGKKALRGYLDGTCSGISGDLALKQATGSSAEDLYKRAVADFPRQKKKLEPKIQAWKLEGLTQISPENPELFQSILNSLKPPAREDLEYEDIPDLYPGFLANVNSFAGKVEGDFSSPTGLAFYLWKKGNYRWAGTDFQADVFPGDQVFLRFSNGTSYSVWADGKKKATFANGTSLFFWDRERRGRFGADGGRLP